MHRSKHLLRSARSLLGGAIVAMLCACQSDQVADPEWPPLPEGAVAVAYSRVDEPFFGEGIRYQGRLVFRAHADWEPFWHQLMSDLMPVPLSPAIDFSEQMVVAALMGGRGTGGYGIAIEGVYETDNRIIVRVLETSPGALCPLPQVLSAPSIVVALSRRDKQVVFAEATFIRHCDP